MLDETNHLTGCATAAHAVVSACLQADVTDVCVGLEWDVDAYEHVDLHVSAYAARRVVVAVGGDAVEVVVVGVDVVIEGRAAAVLRGAVVVDDVARVEEHAAAKAHVHDDVDEHVEEAPVVIVVFVVVSVVAVAAAAVGVVDVDDWVHAAVDENTARARIDSGTVAWKENETATAIANENVSGSVSGCANVPWNIEY